MQIEGKSAVVTGGASGLGAAVVEALSSAGARVSYFDIGAGEADENAAIAGYHVDITDSGSIAAALERLIARQGVPCILVNCAGRGEFAAIAGPDGPMDMAHFRRMIDVNLVGTVDVIRQVACAMLSLKPDAGERGVIINTSSVADRDGLASEVAYSAAKAGISGITLPLARDLAPYGVRVVTISPGVFDTPLLRDLPKVMEDALLRQTPHPRRFGDPAEFAALAVHIAQNPMLNGETIRLDAALRMGFAHAD